MLGYAISFYETAVIFFLCAGFIVLFLYQLGGKDENLDIKALAVAILKFIIVIVAALVLWKAGTIILQKYYNCPSSGYVSRMVTYDTSHLGVYIADFFDFIVKYPTYLFNMGTKGNFASKMIVFSGILLIIFVAFYAIKRRRVSVFLLGLMAALSPHVLYICTGNIYLPKRSLVGFSFLVAFCLSLAFILLQKVKIKGFKAEWIGIIFSICVLLSQSRQMNECFYVDYQKYQCDLGKMNALVLDLEEKGFMDKPIVFVGLVDEFKYAKGEAVGNTIFNWDRSSVLNYELSSIRIFDFFRCHGYELKKYQGQLDPDVLKLEIEGMENWPVEGSIKELDEYVIVKLGRSKLE